MSSEDVSGRISQLYRLSHRTLLAAVALAGVWSAVLLSERGHVVAAATCAAGPSSRYALSRIRRARVAASALNSGGTMGGFFKALAFTGCMALAFYAGYWLGDHRLDDVTAHVKSLSDEVSDKTAAIDREMVALKRRETLAQAREALARAREALADKNFGDAEMKFTLRRNGSERWHGTRQRAPKPHSPRFASPLRSYARRSRLLSRAFRNNSAASPAESTTSRGNGNNAEQDRAWFDKFTTNGTVLRSPTAVPWVLSSSNGLCAQAQRSIG
jgi:hypothetical protein